MRKIPSASFSDGVPSAAAGVPPAGPPPLAWGAAMVTGTLTFTSPTVRSKLEPAVSNPAERISTDEAYSC